jgi:hypothetical protein
MRTRRGPCGWALRGCWETALQAAAGNGTTAVAWPTTSSITRLPRQLPVLLPLPLFSLFCFFFCCFVFFCEDMLLLYFFCARLLLVHVKSLVQRFSTNYSTATDIDFRQTKDDNNIYSLRFTSKYNFLCFLVERST